MRPRRSTGWRFWLAALLVFLQGCSLFPAQPPAATAAPYFIPPTPVPAGRAAPAPSGQAVPSDADCGNDLIFIEDLTIPDGTVVPPGASLDKQWLVENSGSCAWDERYRLRLIAGPEMGAQPEQLLYPARGGSQVILRILFTAPSEPGSYRSAWQAFRPSGEPFGEPIFIDILVQ